MTSPFSSSLPARSSHKRKRSQPQSMPPFSLTSNPLSHSPSLLSQFAVAGLSETDPAPSSLHPDFPHRGLRRSPSAPTTSATQAEADIDAELDDNEDDLEIFGQAQRTDEVGSKSGKKKKHKGDHQADGGGVSAAVKTLTGSIHHFLSQSEIEKASRAFGLILQLGSHAKPVDVRRHHLWALGAEILMRQGETPGSPSPSSPTLQSLGLEPGANDSEDTERKRQRQQRWGQAVNMPRVRAYYETLTHQYPFDYRRPNVTSALDFWPALVSCELYNIDVERVITLRKLERRHRRRRHEGGAETGSSSQGETSSEDESEDDNARLVKKQEAVRARALKELRDLTRRMDEVMADAPYSTNPQMLRLRSTAGVYIADLVRPLVPDEAGPMEVERGEREREDELSKARRCLAKVLESEAPLSKEELAFMEEPTGGESERNKVSRPTKEKKKKRDRAGTGGDMRGMNSSLPFRALSN